MIPDESAPRFPDEPLPPTAPESADRPKRARFVLMVCAVGFAVIGLASLAAILVSAFFDWTIWPGFVLVSYFFLPIAFVLMCSLILLSAISRRRS
ncbi:hypothetical protein E8P82_06970 [Arthrobacter echini]|uniref:Multidrug ABC transporter ATPase n=1 Tax=Arthrobacter echini TaxID=1529066 RepID=A0A4S5E5I8_9MICC|nr:hypothetical protein [Arthrobacter echini]THJ66683.1 hypothetical protein E8P82_06970 [Arthrobacter echini]